TMSDVELDQIDLKPRSPQGCLRKRIANPPKPFPIERNGRHFAIGIWDRGRCYRLPAVRIVWRELPSTLPRYFGGCLAAGMIQLYPNRDIRPTPNTLQRSAHRGFGFIVPQPDIGVSDATFGENRGCFDRQQCCAGESEMTEMDQMPVGHATVLGRILAHWS